MSSCDQGISPCKRASAHHKGVTFSEEGWLNPGCAVAEAGNIDDAVKSISSLTETCQHHSDANHSEDLRRYNTYREHSKAQLKELWNIRLKGSTIAGATDVEATARVPRWDILTHTNLNRQIFRSCLLLQVQQHLERPAVVEAGKLSGAVEGTSSRIQMHHNDMITEAIPIVHKTKHNGGPQKSLRSIICLYVWVIVYEPVWWRYRSRGWQHWSCCSRPCTWKRNCLQIRF